MVEATALSASANTLHAFAVMLGISADEAVQWEEPDQIRWPNHTLTADRVRLLAWQTVEALVRAFPAGLSCGLYIGSLAQLSLDTSLTRAQFDDFRANIPPDAEFTLRLSIDKQELILSWLGASNQGIRRLLYLSPEALERALTWSLDAIEKSFWNDQPRRLVILVANRDLQLEGPHLCALSGTGLAVLPNALSNPPDVTHLANVYRVCRESLVWGN